MRILIAEDEAIVARDLAEILDEAGHTVIDIVDTAEAVLQVVAMTHPDLVLMDICLHGDRDGIVAGQHVRDDYDVPVVYLTAHADQATVHRAAQTGPFGYLIKPFNEQVLQSTIDIAYYKHQMEQRLRASEQQLAASVIALERRTYELATLSELGGNLLRCKSVEESYAAIAQATSSLFANADGTLYMLENQPSVIEPAITWGLGCHSPAPLNQEQCQAYRDERIFVGVCTNLACACHVPRLPARLSFCVPLIVEDDVLGILHILLPPAASDTAAEPAFDATQRPLAMALAEQAALGIANLRMRAVLREEAIRDSLTGLFNRRYLEETLLRERHRALRHQYPIGVMLLDLDYFKQINDTFGHDAGDHLLRVIGRLLLTQVRAEDIVCRYGGEEFVVILPSAPPDVTFDRAEVIRQAVSALCMTHDDQMLPAVTISIGIASIASAEVTGNEALRQADKALYQAKAAGRNRTVVAQSALRMQDVGEER